MRRSELDTRVDRPAASCRPAARTLCPGTGARGAGTAGRRKRGKVNQRHRRNSSSAKTLTSPTRRSRRPCPVSRRGVRHLGCLPLQQVAMGYEPPVEDPDYRRRAPRPTGGAGRQHRGVHAPNRGHPIPALAAEQAGHSISGHPADKPEQGGISRASPTSSDQIQADPREDQPARGEEANGGRRHQAAPQVVQDLPPAHGAEGIGLAATTLHGRAPWEHPVGYLPVASDPPVLPRRVGDDSCSGSRPEARCRLPVRPAGAPPLSDRG